MSSPAPFTHTSSTAPNTCKLVGLWSDTTPVHVYRQVSRSLCAYGNTSVNLFSSIMGCCVPAARCTSNSFLYSSSIVLLMLNGGELGRVILSRTSNQKQRGHCMYSSILLRLTLNGAVCPGLYGCDRSLQ